MFCINCGTKLTDGAKFCSNGIGLMAGFHNSKKMRCTCLSCGHNWTM